MTESQREAYEERAAIMEYDGELSREDAEREAYQLAVNCPSSNPPANNVSPPATPQ